LSEAVTHARRPENYGKRVSYKGRPIFAQGSIVIPFNFQPKKAGDLVEAVPLYADLDQAYKMYYLKSSANSFTNIGPGGRGWHITYAYPLDLIKYQYSKMEDSWAKNWPAVGDGRPLVEQMFLRIGLDGNRDLYMHVDFIKELIPLKRAADLHHFKRQTKSHKSKDGSEKDYDEMAHVSLWGEDAPDGSETHPEGATPAPFIKKPDPATYKKHLVAYDLAPDWMEFGKKYYTFDYHYFYDNFEEMARDITEDGNSRAVNKDKPYINIYNFLNVFKPGALTIDELFEYIDYSIEGSQHYQQPCGVSLLSDYLPADWKTENQGDWATCNHIIKPPYVPQKDTFKNMKFGGEETGINLAIMISISGGESSMGRTKESHEDGDPFNHGGGYNNNCDFCRNDKKCTKTLGATLCNACRDECPSDFKNQAEITPYIIKTWPLYWKDQVIKGIKKAPIFGFKGGGIAQGYNPSIVWGPHMAAGYYKMDRWLGFCEKKRINKIADPIGDEVMIFLNPTMTNDTNLIDHIKNNTKNYNQASNPCTKY